MAVQRAEARPSSSPIMLRLIRTWLCWIVPSGIKRPRLTSGIASGPPPRCHRLENTKHNPTAASRRSTLSVATEMPLRIPVSLLNKGRQAVLGLEAPTSGVGPSRVKTFFILQKLHAAGRNRRRRDRLSLFLLYRVRSQSGRNLAPRRTT
jgi:hypothetical protein